MKALTKNDYEILYEQIKGCLRIGNLNQIESLMMSFEKKKYLNQKSNGDKIRKNRSLGDSFKTRENRVFKRISVSKTGQHQNATNNQSGELLLFDCQPVARKGF